ncbi:MAG: DJ-1/PfpI family protein, partial [Pseudomonadota bacterium]
MKSIAVLVFPKFQTLDVFGPLELFGWLPEAFSITLVAEHSGTVESRSGQHVVVDQTLDERHRYDILLVPGGPGTPVEQLNPVINEWLLLAAKNA